MLITELQRDQWASFFERLMSELAVTWVSIEIDAPALGHQVEAHDLILEDVSYDRRDDVLEISASHPGPSNRAVLRHMIEHPARVSVDSPAGILPAAIEIEGVDGIVTLVRLHRSPSLSS